MKKILALSVLSILLMGVAAQNVVYPLSEKNNHKESIVYYLPKTEVVMVAHAQQVVEKPGPFYKYAERYLGITDVIVREHYAWELVDIKIEQQSVPDPDKGFIVVPGKKGIAPLLNFTTDRILKGINLNYTCPDQKAVVAFRSTPEKNMNFDLSILGEEALQANSIPKMAEMAAKQIYHIREARTAFLLGENEQMPDGMALQQMLDELDQSEAELLALFVGKRTVRQSEKRFPVVVEGAVSNYVVCRISSLNGILSADDLMGSPVYMTVEPNIISQPATTGHKKAHAQPTGYTFNNPGSAVITITDSDKFTIKETIWVPQFGTVEALPVSLCNDPQIRIVYDVNTGTISSIGY